MGSITQSPDRVAQVLSGSVVLQGAGDSAVQAADSNPQVVEQALTGISAADFVYDSRQQHSSVSEGVASAGHPPQLAVDRMDETLPAHPGGGDHPAPSAAGAYEGETSGGNNEPTAAEESNGYDDGRAMPAPRSGPAQPAICPQGPQRPNVESPMDFQATASTHLGPPHTSGKRKCFSGGSTDMLEAKRPEGLSRVPSDMAMVTGMSDGEGGEGGEPVAASLDRHLEAPCDSAMAGIAEGVAAAATAGGETAQRPINLADAGVDGGAVRPTDADIIDWENRIREEEVRNNPLIGDREPIESLEAEYQHGSGVFLAKIAALRADYDAIRRTRGDGNCFFRSFVFAYLESILQTADFAERDAFVGRLLDMQARLVSAGYEELVIETPMELLLGMVRSVGAAIDPLTQEALETNMRSDDVSNYIVFLLRLITSAEVKRRAEFFAPFVMGMADMDIDTFCAKCIDPMGEESDHVQMVALTDALRVPVRVIYLDRSTAPLGSGGGDGGIAGGEPGVSFASGVGGATSVAGTLNSAVVDSGNVRADVHDFVPEGMTVEPGRGLRVCLLYRPGHYDIVYECSAYSK